MKYIKLIALLLSIIIVFTACSLSETSMVQSHNSINSTESFRRTNYDTISTEEDNDQSYTDDTSAEIIDEIVSDKTFDNSDNTSNEPDEPEHIHDFLLTNSYESTCISEGTIVYECECGKQRIEKVAKQPHNYELFSIIEPTFTTTGTRTYQCTMCESTYTKEIKMLHKNAVDNDMCGDSLIKKALPHLPMYDVIKDMLDVYNEQHPQYNGTHLNRNGYYYLPDWLDEDEFWDFLYNNYRYLLYEFPPYFILEKDEGRAIWLYYNENTARKSEKAYTKAQEIIDSLGITKNTTQKEAIILINNYLCDLKIYAQATDATLYGSLTETVGVCHNYAEAFQILCLTAGIECQYYSSKEMNHAWNKIYFSDGTYLWVDVTWNDSVYTNDRSLYLLVDDNTLKKTHQI